MKLAPVIARLQDRVAALRSVHGAADFANASQHLKIGGVAFVLPLSEAAGDNQVATGYVRQRITTRFGVLLAVKNVATPTAEAAIAEIDGLIDQVKAALIGWLHPDASRTTLYAAGRAMGVDAERVTWWICEFTSDAFYRTAGES